AAAFLTAGALLTGVAFLAAGLAAGALVSAAALAALRALFGAAFDALAFSGVLAAGPVVFFGVLGAILILTIIHHLDRSRPDVPRDES
ncbi:MAG: hypothetical protein O7F75_03125, partial [Alphaproteobacteria bacterium]|nr:hypothetical protein [Alphaproteobacteria bacterium]